MKGEFPIDPGVCTWNFEIVFDSPLQSESNSKGIESKVFISTVCYTVATKWYWYIIVFITAFTY